MLPRDLVRTLYLWRWNPALFFEEVTGRTPTTYQNKFFEIIRDLQNDAILICSGTGLGKTFSLAAVALWSATCLPLVEGLERYDVAIASGSLKQARYVYRYLSDFIDNSDILQRLVVGEVLKTKVSFRKGEVRCYPASPKSLFGVHANLLIIDEAVEAGDDVFVHLGRITLPCFPRRVILSSTPHRYTSRFVELWLDRKRYTEWLRLAWSPLEAPWISSSEIERIRKRLTDEEFRSIILGEPTPLADTVFSLKALRNAAVDAIETKKEVPAIMGIDWGFTISPTAIVIIQEVGEEIRVVYTREFWKPDMDRLLDEIVNLTKVYDVQKVFCDIHQKGENQRLRKKGVRVTEVTGEQRKESILKVRSLLLDKKLLIPRDSGLLQQMLRLTPTTKKGDDLIDAFLFALRGTVWERREPRPLFASVKFGGA